MRVHPRRSTSKSSNDIVGIPPTVALFIFTCIRTYQCEPLLKKRLKIHARLPQMHFLLKARFTN
jgi:hypothetical protein